MALCRCGVVGPVHSGLLALTQPTVLATALNPKAPQGAFFDISLIASDYRPAAMPVG